MKEKMIDLLNELYKEGLFPQVFGELISCETSLTKEECEKKLEIINDIIEALPETEISDKDKGFWVEKSKDAKRIIQNEINNFKK